MLFLILPIYKSSKRQRKNIYITKIPWRYYIIFGSRARGDYYSDSDYDLEIISNDFKNKSFVQRQNLVRNLVREVLPNSPIETICYTPEEYKKGLKGFLPEKIEKEGISTK